MSALDRASPACHRVGVDAAELMDVLLGLAAEASLSVRLVGGPDETTSSAVCLVRGQPWVVLSRSDPVDVQIDVLVRALRDHAGELIEGRYLPPAVRDRLDDV